MPITKFSNDRRQQILAVVRSGGSLGVACLSAGVDPSNERQWRVQGRMDREAGLDTEHARYLGDFEVAQADAVHVLERQMHKHSPSDWRATAWLLTRKLPEVYAKEAAGPIAAKTIEVFLEQIRKHCQPSTFEDVVDHALGAINVKELKP